jgi:hypothetical protein
MRRISLLLFCLVFSSTTFSQVVSPAEIKDPELRALQEQNLDELKRLGSDILSIPTEYSFYLSRRLDLDEQQQKRSDQRSIRFDHYKSKVILEITGNYYAAYSGEKMNPTSVPVKLFCRSSCRYSRLRCRVFRTIPACRPMLWKFHITSRAV